jgi:hypothetical protein
MEDATKKKIWFIGYHGRFWLPVSWEGWLLFVGMFAMGSGLAALGRSQGQFSLAHSWPMLIAVFGYLAAFYWVSRGHVDKRY